MEAGRAFHPDEGRFVDLPLPYGSKARLILCHLNREALIHGSPEIEVGGSLTAFVKRIRGFDGGREIRMFKDQLGALAASTVRLAHTGGDRPVQVDTKVVSAFDLWFPKDERQRVLWPSVVQLSLDYFDSLTRHAVPLDERAVAALAHSPLALDLYAWLAQRLHRVEPRKPAFIPWHRLHDQFGATYSSIRKFRQKFRHTLTMVQTQYRAARIELDDDGIRLYNSPPPIKGRYAVVRKG
jgi:hypothetical protein